MDTRRRLVATLILLSVLIWAMWNYKSKITALSTAPGKMIDQTLNHFLSNGKIQAKDAASVAWYHAANSKSKISDALKSVVSHPKLGSAHMIEADVILRGHDPKEPIMAHPPETDSDITLRDWLKEVLLSDKGIKIDFKSLDVLAPSLSLLEEVRGQLRGPVWLNADILSGPGGKATPLNQGAFLEALNPGSPGDVLSLGWTTGWSPDGDNPGYSWKMVQEMEELCRPLKQSVTFPVRAALLSQSFTQLLWLLQQSDRYSLTVWTGQTDRWSVEDLLPYRQNIEKSRIYYDLLESQNSAFRNLPGYS